MEATLHQLYEAILEGDRARARAQVEAALAAGLAPATVLHDGMIAAMQEVGRRFEAGDYFVPEMLIAARAMQEGLGLLKPHLVRAEVQSAGKVIIGTVQGDLHDIGKNLVAMMLEGAGFEVIDLGVDVPPARFVDAVRQGEARLLAMSALLTTTMPGMDATIRALEAAGLRERVRVMVGGAPVTEGFARQIAADGFAPDASRAVGLARSLLAAPVS